MASASRNSTRNPGASPIAISIIGGPTFHGADLGGMLAAAAGMALVIFSESLGAAENFARKYGYQIDSNWRAALSVSNVFDRVYYQTIGSPIGGNWYGEPRGLLFRLDAKY